MLARLLPPCLGVALCSQAFCGALPPFSSDGRTLFSDKKMPQLLEFQVSHADIIMRRPNSEFAVNQIICEGACDDVVGKHDPELDTLLIKQDDRQKSMNREDQSLEDGRQRSFVLVIKSIHDIPCIKVSLGAGKISLQDVASLHVSAWRADLHVSRIGELNVKIGRGQVLIDLDAEPHTSSVDMWFGHVTYRNLNKDLRIGEFQSDVKCAKCTVTFDGVEGDIQKGVALPWGPISKGSYSMSGFSQFIFPKPH